MASERIFHFHAVRTKVTEQVNVITTLLTVVFSATAYGWIEGTVYPYYPFKNNLQILSHFTWYHVVFFMLFLVIGFSLSVNRVIVTGVRKYYLLAASAGSVLWGFWIEDMSYFGTTYYANPPEFLKPGAWIEAGLSGFPFFGHWIPNMYLVLCGAGFILFASAFLLARRDTIASQSLRDMTVRIRPRWSAVKLSLNLSFLFMLFAQPFNLLAASLTNLAMPSGVQSRILLVLLTVLVPSLVLLLIMDTAATRYSLLATLKKTHE